MSLQILLKMYNPPPSPKKINNYTSGHWSVADEEIGERETKNIRTLNFFQRHYDTLGKLDSNGREQILFLFLIY